MHVSVMKHCGSAKQHPGYNVKENSEGINGLQELEMDAFPGQDDYIELKRTRVTGSLGWCPSNQGQSLSCVIVCIDAITVTLFSSGG